MITPQQIDLWLTTSSEHQRLEFKEAKIQYDNRKLYKYCVAIANEGGGHLVLGVSDAKPRKVVGSAAFNDPVKMVSKLFQAVGFRVGFKSTTVVLYGPRSFKKMDRIERIRACYQHCVLQWVLRRQMTNQSLRERFGLSNRSTNTVSQIITAAMESNLIKLDPNAPSSRKFARYLPTWA